MSAQILAKSFHPPPIASIRERGPSVNRLAPKVLLSPLPDRTVPFEHQAERIETSMTSRASLVLPVPGQNLAQSQVAQLTLIIRQHGNIRRRRRDGLSQ